MKVYDISQEVFGCNVFPGDPQPEREVKMRISDGAICNLTAFSMCAHNGTHVDAPYHFIDGAKTIDQVDMDRFIGLCYVAEHEGDVTAEDAKGFINAAKASDMKAAERILVKGKATVTLEAAKVFAEEGIKLFGNESQTVGPEDAPMAVHLVMLGAEIVLLEGIRLADVPEGVYLLNSAPINLGGSDGAPCRATLISVDDICGKARSESKKNEELIPDTENQINKEFIPDMKNQINKELIPDTENQINKEFIPNSDYQIIRINENTWRIEDGHVRCFLLCGTERAALIDSGMNLPNARKIAEGLTDREIILINTHADRDHISGNGAFDKVYMSPKEIYDDKDKIIPISEGDVIDLGGRTLRIIDIPGHTPGSIAILDERNRILVSGDSVQNSDIFMFGDRRDIKLYIDSLKHLKEYDGKYDEVYPMHGTMPEKPELVDKLIEGAEAIRDGKAQGEEVNIFGNDVYLYKFPYAGFLHDK